MFEFTLLETHGWVNREAGRPATREEFLEVLGDLEGLWIRGRFNSDSTAAGSLDEVVLLGAPSGPLVSTLALRRLSVVSLEGQVGRRYRVEFRSVIDPSVPWTTLEEVVLDKSPFTLVDPGSHDPASRFYRALLIP